MNHYFFESAENSAPLLPRTCMFCKIFSDDQEMATNQKIGLCDYLRTEWIGIPTVAVGSSLEIGCPRVKIEKIISLEILELRAENPPIRVVVCHYRFSFWSNSPTRPYGARNGPLRCTMG